MAIPSLLLIMAGVALMAWAVYTYFANTLPGPMDVMGRSITFSTWWGAGATFCAIGVGLLPALVWWWGLVVFAVLYPASVLLQPVLDLALRVLLGRGAG